MKNNNENGKVDFNATYNEIFLGTFKNVEVLKEFTECLFDINIPEDDIQILDSSIHQGVELKSSIVDIRYSILNMADMILDMQNRKTTYDILERILYYASHQISESIPRGESYVYNKCLTVAILNFTYFKDDNNCIRSFKIKSEYSDEIKKLEIVIIELTKRKYCVKKKLKDWLELLTTDTPNKYYGGNSGMDKAIDKIYFLNQDQELRNKLWNERIRERDREAEKESIKAIKERLVKEGLQQGLQQGLEQGLQQGIEQGIEQGKEQEKIEVAKSMLKENLEITLISKVTGLSVEQIKKL